MVPLLITATFDVSGTPEVVLRDLRERVVRHMEGLLAWIEDGAFSQIVFAKNCRCPINGNVLRSLGKSKNVGIEYLELSPSRRTATQGKGYGEGEIVRKALERSTFLKSAHSFAKCTGKLFIANHYLLSTKQARGAVFQSCASPSRPQQRGFLAPFYRSRRCTGLFSWARRRLRIPWNWLAAPFGNRVDTRFYVFERQFYIEHLMDSHLRVEDSLGYPLEAAFGDDLATAKSISRVPATPIVHGTSGTLGTTAAVFSQSIHQKALEITNEIMLK